MQNHASHQRDWLAVLAALGVPLADTGSRACSRQSPRRVGSTSSLPGRMSNTITRTTDIETTVLILDIGAAVTELAVWGRQQHFAARLARP